MDMKQALFALSACTGPSGAEHGVYETASGILERSDAQAQTLVRQFILSLPSAAGYTVEFE